MRWRAFSLLVVLAATSAPAAPPTKPKALVRVVERWLVARAEGDVDRAQRMLAPGARIHFGSREGEGEPIDLRSPSAEWDRELHATLEPEGDLRVEGRTVIGTFVERSDFYRLLDISGWRATIAFRVDEQGRIAQEVYVPLRPPDNPDFAAAFAPAREWLQRERPADALELLPSGKLVRSGITAARWRDLLVQWRSSTGRPAVRTFSDGEVRELPKLPHGMLDPPELR